MAERQLQVLGRLAEIGLSIAAALEQQVTTEGASGVANDPALAYARVARAVRLTVALQSAVLKDLQALAGPRPAASMNRAARPSTRASDAPGRTGSRSNACSTG